ncbi:MAG: S49 family peptidase [Hyphomicrobiaceae bacterium]
MWPFSTRPTVPVLRFNGPIGMATPLRPGLSIGTLAGPIERAFSMSKLPGVAIIINSPGGSAVQSSLILQRIRQLADEKKKKVYVFCEDVAASGGYYLAVAGDEIYADQSSIIGSIGVIAATFGFDKAIEKLGIDRRIYTAGRSKSTLDAFMPEKEEDVDRIKAVQRDIHSAFIDVVKHRRTGRLKAADEDLFTGAFWSASQALEYGLIDGIGNVRGKMRELFGDTVRLRVVPISSGGLLSRLRRVPAFEATVEPLSPLRTAGIAAGLGDELLSSIEARLLWSRFGL